MAIREFRITDAQAQLHDWNIRDGEFLECARCQAIAIRSNGTYYLMCDGLNRNCDIATHTVPHANRPSDSAAIVAAIAVYAEVNGIHVHFPPGSDPVYVAAVLCAVRKAS